MDAATISSGILTDVSYYTTYELVKNFQDLLDTTQALCHSRHQNIIAFLHPERHVPQLVKKYGTSPHIVVRHVNGIGYLHPRVSDVAITMNDTVGQRRRTTKHFMIIPSGVSSSSHYSRAKLFKVLNYGYGEK